MTDLQTAFEELGAQFNRIIDAFSRKEAEKDPMKTYAYYSDGSVVEYDIVGLLRQNAVNSTNLTKLEIGNAVTGIQYNTLVDCSGLTSVTIPDSVTSIGDSAFSGSGCVSTIPYLPEKDAYIYMVDGWTIGNNNVGSISNLDLSEIQNLRGIGDDSFAYCGSLMSITIPDTVVAIGESAFGYYSSGLLTSVEFGNGLRKIGPNAFYDSFDSFGQISITIPSSVVSIGKDAFWNEYMDSFEITFLGKTTAQVQAMSNYPWSTFTDNMVFHCIDGDINVAINEEEEESESSESESSS